jgi:hypothetical protein
MSLACGKAKELGYPHELWTTRLLARHAREQRLFVSAVYFGSAAPIARLVETRKPLIGIADPPLRDRASRASNCTSNRAARHAVRSQKHDPSPPPQMVLGPRRARQKIEIGALLHRQNDRCRFRELRSQSSVWSKNGESRSRLCIGPGTAWSNSD